MNSKLTDTEFAVFKKAKWLSMIDFKGMPSDVLDELHYHLRELEDILLGDSRTCDHADSMLNNQEVQQFCTYLENSHG